MIRMGYDASVTLAPGGAGIARYTLELLRALVELSPEDIRYSVLLNSLRHRPDERHAFLFDSPRVDVAVRRLPGPLVVRGWETVRLPLWRTLVGHTCGVVHAPASYIPPTLSPTVVTIHDLAFLREDEARPLAGESFAREFPRRLPAVAAIIVPSRFVASCVETTYGISPARIHTIASGIDHSIFRCGEPQPRRFDVLAITQEGIARKRSNWVAPILERLRASRPDLRAGVLGMPTEPLPPWAERLGRVDDTQLAGLYRSSGATLLTTREEGFGFPVLESLACGTPVVCPKHSSLPEVGGDSAHFSDDDSVESLASRLAAILDAPPGSQWKDEAARHVSEFRWSGTVTRVLEVYRAVGGAN